MSRKQWLSWSVMTILFLAIGLIEWIYWEQLMLIAPFLHGVFAVEKGAGMDLFFAQTSLTFISISVLSMLSEKSIVIYWEDQIERKLINPPFGSFLSMTRYSFILLVLSFLVIVFADGEKSYGLALTYFLVNIFVLAKLTFDMIGLYFNRDVRMHKLQKEFIEHFYKVKPDNRFTAEDLDITEKRIDEFANCINEIDVKNQLDNIKNTANVYKNSIYEMNYVLEYKMKYGRILFGAEECILRALVEKIDKVAFGFLKKIFGFKAKSNIYRSLFFEFLKELLVFRFNASKFLKIGVERFEKKRQALFETPFTPIGDVINQSFESLSQFDFFKLELLGKTKQYLESGEIKELKENLHLIANCFRFFSLEDLNLIVEKTPDMYKHLVYTELFHKLLDYRHIMDKEYYHDYWLIIQECFEQFSSAGYFLKKDIVHGRLIEKENLEIGYRTPLQRAIYDMLKCSKDILNDNFSIEEKTLIADIEWRRIVSTGGVTCTSLEQLFVDIYQYLTEADNELFLTAREVLVPYYEDEGYDVTWCDLKDETEVYELYLKGVKRIQKRRESLQEINSLLESFYCEDTCSKNFYNIFIEGIISELEKEDGSKWTNYSYENLKVDFLSIVDSIMEDRGMESWHRLEKEHKHSLLFYQYAYIAHMVCQDEKLAEKREKIDCVIQRISRTMHFGDELCCDEEGLGLFIYAYYKQFIREIDKIMARFYVYDENGKKKICSKKYKNQMFDALIEKSKITDVKKAFMNQIAEKLNTQEGQITEN